MDTVTTQTLYHDWRKKLISVIAGNTPSLNTEQLEMLRTQARSYNLKHGQGLVVLAQINVTPGCLKENAKKIGALLQASEALKLDLVVFPELALMGYSPKDIILRFPFLVAENLKWLEALAEQTQNTHALVGFVEPNTDSVGKPYFNSVALLGQGKILQVFRKALLPSYNEFEDTRQFQPYTYPHSNLQSPQNPATESPVFDLYGKRYGILICEDMWQGSSPFANPLYTHNPIDTVMASHPDVVINCSASPSRQGKAIRRHLLCQSIAKNIQVPLLYVNQVGTIDETSFDGGSRAYSGEGRLFSEGLSFSEDCLILDPFQNIGTLEDSTQSKQSSFTENYPASDFIQLAKQDLPRTYQSIVQGIRDYFSKTGFQRAVLGLSGGLDSSVTAVLLADALGAGNVLGLRMPSLLTPKENQDDAETLANRLGLVLHDVPITPMIEASQSSLQMLYPALDANWPSRDPASNASDNIQAMTRASILRQVGNTYRALPIATSDKSEFYLGYATVNGDMSGALAPLGDVCKTKVRALAAWLNNNRTVKNVLPERIISKPSGADLKRDSVTGQLVTAESELMPYLFADEVIWRIETMHQSYQDMLKTVFSFEKTTTVSPEEKKVWLNRFFKKMAQSAFKWFIAPPLLMIDQGGSLAKSDYHHPVVSSKIEWQGNTPDEIAAILAIQS